MFGRFCAEHVVSECVIRLKPISVSLSSIGIVTASRERVRIYGVTSTNRPVGRST